MKKIFLAVVSVFSLGGASASNQPYLEVRTLYQHLVDINHNWANYITEEGVWEQKVVFANDHALITTDLLLVEEFLRSKDVRALSKELQETRERNLDEFHDYIMAGNFPKNYDHEERRPCFIDRDGGVCAVGNLLVKSGQKELAYYIAANYEYAFVPEMNVEQLVVWQQHSGLSAEELALIQPTYGGGWGGRNYYDSKNPNSIQLAYGIDMLAINTHRSLFSLRPEAYKHLYSYSYGVSLTRTFNKKKNIVETGCLFISDQYLHTVEGSMGPKAQYGKILTQLNPNYIGIPLLLGFGSSDSRQHSWVKFGYRLDLLQNLGCSVIPLGVTDSAEISNYTFGTGDYAMLRHSLLLNFAFDKQLDMGKDRMWVHFEPAFSFQLNNDQTGSEVLPYKPVVMGLNVGIAYNLPQNQKHDQRKADRKKRRDARKLRKEQLKEKKRQEKEKKE